MSLTPMMCPSTGCLRQNQLGDRDRGGWAYQSSGIGAVEAEEGDRRLHLLARGRRGKGAGLAEESTLGSCRPRGAQQCLSREHGDWGDGVR